MMHCSSYNTATAQIKSPPTDCDERHNAESITWSSPNSCPNQLDVLGGDLRWTLPQGHVFDNERTSADIFRALITVLGKTENFNRARG